jgi:hypothetical protein
MAIFDGLEFLDGFRAATAGGDWTNQVSTSWLVTIAAFRPLRAVGAITAPVLYQLGDDDGGPGLDAVGTMAARTRDADVAHYAAHHFGVFAPDHLGRYCADAVEFLRSRAILKAPEHG